MNGTTTQTPCYPHFAPGEDRALLAQISRWRKDNGWTRTHFGSFVNADSTITVGYSEAADLIGMSRRTPAGNWQLTPDHYPADSIRKAVDLLVALGILPAHFSSQYEAGFRDANGRRSYVLRMRPAREQVTR